jgi:CheY-like chemotaxis protein
LAILKSHRGWLDVQSQEGSGSTFRVFLPAESSLASPPELEAGEPPTGAGELLLVVDDEVSIREILKTTLEAHGYEVVLAGEGTEAVAVYAENMGQIDLVLTDLVMPVLDGPATIRALRKLDPSARFLVLSGLAEKEKLSRAVTEEGVTLLPKPYSTRSLLTAIHRVLNSPPEPA